MEQALEPGAVEQAPRRYLVRTFGCQMNAHDSERIAGVLESDGMEPARSLDEADVIVLNSCCIRENADNKLYGHLGHLASLKRERPSLKIMVGGCLAQKDAAALVKRSPHVDVVFGTHNVGRCGELLRQSMSAGSGPAGSGPAGTGPAGSGPALSGPAVGTGTVSEIWEAGEAVDNSLFPSALPSRRRSSHSAWVSIQVGCDNTCAYCIVPAVRGREASRPFGDIVAEVGELARSGVSEVTLLGQNVNSYGRDLSLGLARRGGGGPGVVAGPDIPARAPGGSGADEATVHLVGPRLAASPTPRARPLFADLLSEVGGVPGIRRVRFTSPHPKDFNPEAAAAMASAGSVCEHLHLPLQSGSDRVLSAMRRGYTAERYMSKLGLARQAVGDLAVTTDVIVGFPGETASDFDQTMQVVVEAYFDSAYTFVFSPRPGTLASTMTSSFVPAGTVSERFARLKVVVDRQALKHAEERVGREEEVLVDGPSKRDATMLSGRTRQNKLVHFAPPAGAASRGTVPGSYVTVLVTAAAPHHLMAELVEVAGERVKPARRAVAGRARAS
ncbi:MAG: MiaB/RimO family radical SAM methylthiotransferase [Acidimicrobiales bacterium]